jgi:acyl carrier protein
VNLDVLRARLPEQLGDEQEGDGPRLFTLGPRWQNNPYTWGRPGGDTSELLLHLELAGELAAEAAEHIAHPTLLDSATGSARRAGEAPHLPFLYRELFVYEPLPAHLFAHIRRRTATSGVIIADVDLIAPDGRLLGRAVEYTMRQVDDRQFLEEPPTAGQGTMPPPRAADEDIEPQDGARLFMTLLGSRHPGQVLVEPGARPVRRTATRPVPRGTATPAGRGTAVDAATPAGPGLSALTAAPASTPTRTAEPAGVPTGAQPGSVEARLQALWTEAFGEPDIALDADFFELGGNSLSAVELMTKVRGEFGVEVSIAALFDYPTIAHLAEVLREQGAR